MKKKTEGIKITAHKTVGIPVPKDGPRHMYVVASVDARKGGHRSRAWSFWETEEDAIKLGIKAWDDAEFFYEAGYYTHIVIEAIMLNHPIATYVKERKMTWFRLQFTPNKKGPASKLNGRCKAIRCHAPKRLDHIVGFYNPVLRHDWMRWRK